MAEEEKSIQRRLRDLTLLMGSMLTVLAGATLSPALPEIHAAFLHVPHAIYLVKLILTLPALFIGLGAFFFGYLLDRWGRKPVLIISLLLFGVAGSAGFYLHNLYFILGARALQGLAVAGVMTGFTTLIADYFVDRHLTRFMALQVTFMTFGGVLFLILGGVLADVGWHYPFLLYLFAFVLLPPLIFFIHEPKPSGEKARGPSGAVRSPRLWIVILIYSGAFVGMIIFYLIPTQLPFHLKSLLGISTTSIGVAIATKTFFAGISSLAYPKLKENLSFKILFILAFSLLSLGFFALGWAASYLEFILALAVGGLGFGILLPSLNLFVVSFVPPELRGRAVGGLATAIFLGQFMSPIIAQPIIEELEVHRSFALAGIVLIFLAFLFFLGEVTFRRKKPNSAWR